MGFFVSAIKPLKVSPHTIAVKYGMAENPYIAFVKKYRSDPVSFVREVLNQPPDPWQIEFLEVVALGERKLSIHSGHGTRSASRFRLAWLLLHAGSMGRNACRFVGV